MNLGFILSQMNHLRYIIPLIAEANRRGIHSIVFSYKSIKYNSPHKHPKETSCLSEKFSFDIKDFSCIKDFVGTVFVIEGVFANEVPLSNKKISLICSWDFVPLYDKYVNIVDKIVFPSKFIARHENKVSEKNLYLGSSKYDIKLDKQKILEKYKIKSKKNALIIYPNFSALKAKYGHKKIKYTNIYEYLRKIGYNVIVKARGKARALEGDTGDQYFEDFSWFPHDTMELIEVCDMVVISGSSAAEECIMLNQPFIEFSIALVPVVFEYLYNYDYCKILDPSVQFEEFKNAIIALLSKDHNESFKEARKNHLFEKGDVSKKILDSIL